VRAKSAGEEQESNNDETNERANDETERERESIFFFAKIFD
jgi:hypothetical protein